MSAFFSHLDALNPRQARRLLDRLDIPECDCDYTPLPCDHHEDCDCGSGKKARLCCHPCDCPLLLPPPCRHVRKRLHDLTCRQWAELCLSLFPDEYAEPVRRGKPSRRLLRAERVEVYALREALGLSLWNPRDRWIRQPVDDSIQEGPAAERINNGYLNPQQRLAAARRGR